MTNDQSHSSNTQINPLGHASPERYSQDSWPLALLGRMAFWVKELHPSGRHILDIGCGEGALLHRLGFSGVGVDLNTERLALAKVREIAVMQGDGCNLPFNNQQFSTVVSMEVLEHVPEMARMMQEVYRVLEPGGYWIVSVPSVTLRSRYEMWREKRPYYCDGEEHYREFSESDVNGFEHRFMRVSDFIAMFEACGFTIANRDGVRYVFPQWFSRFPMLQGWFESPKRDRLWALLPWVRRFPYWTILVFQREAS